LRILSTTLISYPRKDQEANFREFLAAYLPSRRKIQEDREGLETLNSKGNQNHYDKYTLHSQVNYLIHEFELSPMPEDGGISPTLSWTHLAFSHAWSTILLHPFVIAVNLILA
jgi:hypothetical protein